MRQTGSYAWLFQRVSGAALFVCIILHFFLMHYRGFETRMYESAVSRLHNPLWKTFYLVFLVLGIYHGLNGVWAVVADHVRNAALRIAVLVAVVLVGTVLTLLGAITVLSV